MHIKIHIALFFCILSKLPFVAQTTTPSPCSNAGFEMTASGTYTSASAVSGWTVSSQTASVCNTNTLWLPGSNEFSIVSTPVVNFAGVMNIPHSPLGGTKVAQLNNTVGNNSTTKISTNFSVTSGNNLFQFAFAGYWQSGGHNCCEGPNFYVRVLNCSQQFMPAHSMTVTQLGCYGLPQATSFTAGVNGNSYTNWQVKTIDLSSFVGSCVTIEFVSMDCIHQGQQHFGSVFIDANCSSHSFWPCMCGVNGPTNFINPIQVNYCGGSATAQLIAPQGYVSYQWYHVGNGLISGPTGTMAVLTITNPVPFSNYSVVATSASGSQFSFFTSLQSYSISIVGLASAASCVGGSSGSATVAVAGSASGYNFIWSNTSNSVVATTSVASNLSPGTYSINVTVNGSIGCGTAMATVNIGTVTTKPKVELKPYCSNQAYLNTNGGSSHQWYVANSAIPAPSGTAPSFTITNPSNQSIYKVSYVSYQGCLDTINFVMAASNPGVLNVTKNKPICQIATNGEVELTLIPATGSPPGANYFIVNSVGTLSPAYSSSINPTLLNTFTISNLTSNTIYSVQAFDGSCLYSRTLTPTINLPFNYSISPNTSTLCQNNAIYVTCVFDASLSASQFTYSWSPSTFLASTNTNFNAVSPIVSPGNSINITYSVTVTPTLVNCPVTKTLFVSSANPVTPTIFPITSTFCINAASQYSLNFAPSGGTFSTNITGTNSPVGLTNGVITPSLGIIGVNTFTYINQLGACRATAVSNFSVDGPILSGPNSYSVCSGQTKTLSVGGANIYLWNNSISGSSLVITPSVTSQYTVVGTNTINNCASTKVIPVQVNALPYIALNEKPIICGNYSTSLSVSGPASYTWSNGSTSTTSIFNASSAQSQSILALDPITGCTNSAIFSLTFAPSPTVGMYGDFVICENQIGYLVAFGAHTYTWNNGSNGYLNPIILNSGNIGFTVTGTDTSSGCKNYAAVTVTLSSCVGLDETANENNNLSLYPNPVIDKMQIESIASLDIQIYNEFGQLKLTKTLMRGKNTIDLSNLQDGMYFVSTNSGIKGRGYKFIKIKKN